MNLNLEALVIILVLFVFGFAVISYLFKGGNPRGDWKNIAKARLKDIRFVHISDQVRLKQELINADTLLDYCLKASGTRGDTLGERLKNAKGRFAPAKYNQVWEAHKLRNKLVHEIDVSASAHQLRTAVSDLVQAISHLIGN